MPIDRDFAIVNRNRERILVKGPNGMDPGRLVSVPRCPSCGFDRVKKGRERCPWCMAARPGMSQAVVIG